MAHINHGVVSSFVHVRRRYHIIGVYQFYLPQATTKVWGPRELAAEALVAVVPEASLGFCRLEGVCCVFVVVFGSLMAVILVECLRVCRVVSRGERGCAPLLSRAQWWQPPCGFFTRCFEGQDRTVLAVLTVSLSVSMSVCRYVSLPPQPQPQSPLAVRCVTPNGLNHLPRVFDFVLIASPRF